MRSFVIKETLWIYRPCQQRRNFRDELPFLGGIGHPEYHISFLISKDDTLEQSRDEDVVSPAQGKFLKLIALSIGAKRILEVGTLGGWV